ncbi:hypothetical protein AAEU32_14835 [Pseudoalteromonas sp. SSDWG2]|uniref:hypothetical protein n=1 Tax=Pseudoalteromonas sp. SSDWG2 TaxID=3139391 RepID=UPI003BAAE78F
MTKLVSQLMIVAVVLIAMFGQAAASSAMMCEMSMPMHANGNAMSATSMTMMDHSNMNHQEMEHVSANMAHSMAGDDCCDDSCYCPPNACASYSALNSVPTLADVYTGGESIITAAVQLPFSIHTAFFRPPIFA